MRTGRSRVIFATAFILALIAGAAAGVLATRFAGSQSGAGVSTIPTLEDLQLTSDQRDHIQKIWEGVKNASDESYQQATTLQQQLEKKTLDLLNPEQQERYAKIYQEYQKRFLSLQSDRDKAVKKAVEDTKTLLSDSQRQKYDVILKNRLGRWGDTAPSQAEPMAMPKTSTTRPSGMEL